MVKSEENHITGHQKSLVPTQRRPFRLVVSRFDQIWNPKRVQTRRVPFRNSVPFPPTNSTLLKNTPSSCHRHPIRYQILVMHKSIFILPFTLEPGHSKHLNPRLFHPVDIVSTSSSRLFRVRHHANSNASFLSINNRIRNIIRGNIVNGNVQGRASRVYQGEERVERGCRRKEERTREKGRLAARDSNSCIRIRWWLLIRRILVLLIRRNRRLLARIISARLLLLLLLVGNRSRLRRRREAAAKEIKDGRLRLLRRRRRLLRGNWTRHLFDVFDVRVSGRARGPCIARTITRNTTAIPIAKASKKRGSIEI